MRRKIHLERAPSACRRRTSECAERLRGRLRKTRKCQKSARRRQRREVKRSQAMRQHTPQRSNKLRRRKSWSRLPGCTVCKPCEKAGAGARGWESGSGKGMRRLETRISRCMKPPGPPRSTRLLRTPLAPPRTSTRRAQRSNRESVTHLYPGLSAVSHSNAATGCCCRTRFRACLVAGAWAWPRGRFCAAG